MKVDLSKYAEASKPYCPQGAAKALFYCKDKEILMVGSAGTGKSRAALEKAHLILQKYPKSRYLICRKTRRAMTQSTLVTWESKVVTDGFFKDNIQRSHRQSYMYPNGSELVCGGLDDPANILSTEFDGVIVDECTQISEDDWETLISRLRNGKVPYQQAIGCCNPDSSSHWANLRANSGAMTRLISKHEDNPAVTPEYLEMLNRLTGVRRLRLLEGKWCSAEGQIYEGYDASVHLIHLDTTKAFFSGGFFGAMDFGFTHAGVLQVWGLDHDGRMYLVHEVMKTQEGISWWIEQARKAVTMFGFNLFVCDSARPDHIDALKKKGLNATEAYKAVTIGINAVQERLKVQGDGKPRLYIFDDALETPDPKLVEAKKPWCLSQEIESYVWADNNKEEPKKENDDSCDTMRMAVAHADGLKYGKLIFANGVL